MEDLKFVHYCLIQATMILYGLLFGCYQMAVKIADLLNHAMMDAVPMGGLWEEKLIF